MYKLDMKKKWMPLALILNYDDVAEALHLYLSTIRDKLNLMNLNYQDKEVSVKSSALNKNVNIFSKHSDLSKSRQHNNDDDEGDSDETKTDIRCEFGK